MDIHAAFDPFWSLKALVSIHCNCMEKWDQCKIFLLYFMEDRVIRVKNNLRTSKYLTPICILCLFVSGGSDHEVHPFSSSSVCSYQRAWPDRDWAPFRRLHQWPTPHTLGTAQQRYFIMSCTSCLTLKSSLVSIALKATSHWQVFSPPVHHLLPPMGIFRCKIRELSIKQVNQWEDPVWADWMTYALPLGGTIF